MPDDKQPWLVRAEQLHRTFDTGEVPVHVLKGISFDIYRGEFLAIVGPSGSGKTTVLNLIGGLDQPSSGEIRFARADGRMVDLARANAKELTEYRREQVGFVFQFYNLVPNLTAQENVEIAIDIVANPLDSAETLKMVGLSDRADHFPSQLSGGEQQRVAIARAVAKNPEMLLCDEPTGALDFETGKVVLRRLVDLNRQLRKTVVVITHNAALADVADRIIHIRSGEISNIEINEQPKSPEEVVW
ncbi:MAG: ABC transporter ATP-binding protein [Planctomycetales bacterium]|nr:ABC transporter ATP-binding protein [Planctomycetales bacterium]